MRSWWQAASIAALMLAPAPASAQARDDEEIVVTGETVEQARRQATAYVRELGVATGEKPTARWFDPVCPKAVGLPKQTAALVEQDIRAVARKAGAWLAREGCAGNLIIAFTDDGGAVVKKIARESTLGTSTPSAARELRHGSAPVRWWYTIGPRSKDATASQADSPPSMQVTDASGNRGELPSNNGQILMVSSSSHISTQVVHAINSATVVVDVNRAQGATLKSIAEYAALVGLAEIRLGAAPPNSVLALFDNDRAVRGLTGRDEAFLSALYRTSMDRRADQQRRSIVSTMVQQAASR